MNKKIMLCTVTIIASSCLSQYQKMPTPKGQEYQLPYAQHHRKVLESWVMALQKKTAKWAGFFQDRAPRAP